MNVQRGTPGATDQPTFDRQAGDLPSAHCQGTRSGAFRTYFSPVREGHIWTASVALVNSGAEDKPLISHGFLPWGEKKEELLPPVGTEKKALASIYILYTQGAKVKQFCDKNRSHIVWRTDPRNHQYVRLH